MSRRRRLSLLIAGGLAVLTVLVLLGLYWAVRYEPAFYREALEIDPPVLEKASDHMLQQTAALESAVRKKGRWEALFTAEQINGWLAVDRAKNHPDLMPPTWRDPRVAIDSKQVTIACRYQGAWLSSVLSLTVEPYVPEPNVLAVRIVRARAGLLPVPLGRVLDRLSRGRPRHATPLAVAAGRRRPRGHALVSPRASTTNSADRYPAAWRRRNLRGRHDRTPQTIGPRSNTDKHRYQARLGVIVTPGQREVLVPVYAL